MKQLVLDIAPPPRPTFANLVSGRNREALAVLQGMASDAASCGAKVVYLWGEASCGKSHALAALGDAGAVTADHARAVDSLVVADDVEHLSAGAQQDLFNLINAQQASGGALVATGHAAPRDLPLRRDLASRLGSGLTFRLHPLDDAEKAAALLAHAKSRGFSLRDDVVGYLLKHGRRDMRSLIGFLDTLDRYSLESGREITVPLLKEVAQPSLV